MSTRRIVTRPPRQQGATVKAIAVERQILRTAASMLRQLRSELDARVSALVAQRLTPIDPLEARIFLADFKRGDLP